MNVTVYTTGPQCQACIATKRKLTDLGIEFTERAAVDMGPCLVETVKAAGWTNAPVVHVERDGEAWLWAGFRPDRIDALKNQDLFAADATAVSA